MEEVYSTVFQNRRHNVADAPKQQQRQLLSEPGIMDAAACGHSFLDLQQEQQYEDQWNAWMTNMQRRMEYDCKGASTGSGKGEEEMRIPSAYRDIVAERFLLKYSSTYDNEQQRLSFPILIQSCTAVATVSACRNILRRFHHHKQPSEKAVRLVLECLEYVLFTDPKATFFQELNVLSSASSDDSSFSSSWIQTMAVAIPRLVTDRIMHRFTTATTAFTSSRAYIAEIFQRSVAFPNLCARFLSHWLSHGNQVDNVVYALYNHWILSTTNNRPSWIAASVVLSLLRDREIGILCRAVLQFSRMDETDHPTTTMEGFVDEIFGNHTDSILLVTHWETITRLIVLSSSSVTIKRRTRKSYTNTTQEDKKVIDLSLCQAYVQVLSRCHCTANPRDEETNDHSDESDSDQDQDEDDDKSVSQKSFPQLQQPWLWSSLDLVVRVWSSPWFVERTDPYLQNHVTVFIVYALHQIVEQDSPTFDRTSVLETSGISIQILEGVTHRLQSTCSTESRLDGMRVAEALAKALGQELQFEELHEQDDYDDDDNDDQQQLDPQASITDPSKSTMKLQSYNDSDKEEKSDDNRKADDDSDWDENSALERYDIEDDEEDLRQVPRPFYLSECLDYLRANNENDSDCYSRHATVLQELPDLVRSRPADLADQAPELARSLLRLENKSGMKDFLEQVTHSIGVLLVEDPLGVGSNMIEEFFVESTLLDRLTILNAMNTAAFELSGDKALLENMTSKQSFFISKWDPGCQGAERSFPKLRYLPITAHVAGGKNIAPHWFYHFFSKFMETKDDATLWGGPNGARLLSSVIVTLTNVVECTGRYSPGVDVLAKDLLDFTWSFRGAEVAIVRSSVLYSVQGTLGLLREEILWNFLLNDSSDSLVRHMRTMQERDPDINCRQLAKAIAQTVVTIVNEIGRQDPLLIETR